MGSYMDFKICAAQESSLRTFFIDKLYLQTKKMCIEDCNRLGPAPRNYNYPSWRPVVFSHQIQC